MTIGLDPAMRALRHAHFCLFDPMGFGADSAARERFNTAVFVAPDRSFLFVKNEKCGSNTVRRTLQRAVAARPSGPRLNDANRWAAPLLQPSDLQLLRVEDLNDAVELKFAVVRDPYARLLSCWLDKFAEGDRKRPKFERALGGAAPAFSLFVERVCAQDAADMNPHWRIQHENIYGARIRFDRFLKFERLESELEALLRALGSSAPIASVQRNRTSAGEKLAAHYTQELARKVADRFAVDFERFGYSKTLDLS